MRLIDADALKLSDFQDFSNTDVFFAIDIEPTVDPIRALGGCHCRECRYHSYDADYGYHWCDLTLSCRNVNENGFCSDGKLETEGTTNER